jgi:hypothetical protein
MQTEEIIKQHRALHRMTMTAGSIGILLLLLICLNQAYDLFVVFSLTDCSFG